MSIFKRSALPRAPAVEWGPHSDRLRVITAGSVGAMEARLGASGFDVVAAAETEDALIDAVSADEADAIVVEADLCDSLEHVRELAPDAVLIVVGDHTPAGALGRVERGMSGTAMAGLLHALVAEGVGAAVVWGLVPTFRAGPALHVPHGMGGSLLAAKADLIRAHLASVLSQHAEIVTTASTVLVTVSASLLVAMSAPGTHDRRERVPVPAHAVERAAQQHPVVALSPSARTPAHSPSRNEGEPGDRRGPNHGESRDHHGHHPDQGENQGNADQGENQGNNDQGENDQGENQGNDDQGENQGKNDQGENDRGENHQGENDQGENHQGENENDNDTDEQGDTEHADDDQGGGGSGDDQGSGGSDDQGDGGKSQE